MKKVIVPIMAVLAILALASCQAKLSTDPTPADRAAFTVVAGQAASTATAVLDVEVNEETGEFSITGDGLEISGIVVVDDIPGTDDVFEFSAEFINYDAGAGYILTGEFEAEMEGSVMKLNGNLSVSGTASHSISFDIVLTLSPTLACTGVVTIDGTAYAASAFLDGVL